MSLIVRSDTPPEVPWTVAHIFWVGHTKCVRRDVRSMSQQVRLTGEINCIVDLLGSLNFIKMMPGSGSGLGIKRPLSRASSLMSDLYPLRTYRALEPFKERMSWSLSV